MIPANPGWVAVFEDEDGTDIRPVEAWSDDGDALVVDTHRGALVPANDRHGFARVTREAAEPPLADECTGCGGPVDDEGDAPDRCLGCSR